MIHRVQGQTKPGNKLYRALLGFTSFIRIISGVICSTIFLSSSMLLLSESALVYMHFKDFLVLILFFTVVPSPYLCLFLDLAAYLTYLHFCAHFKITVLNSPSMDVLTLVLHLDYFPGPGWTLHLVPVVSPDCFHGSCILLASSYILLDPSLSCFVSCQGLP